MPLNLLAGMGGMSEYSAMSGATDGINSYALAYGLYSIVTVVVGIVMYLLMRLMEVPYNLW